MPVVKQDITKMSVEELALYVEAVRKKRRQRSKKHYDEVIKNDPKKYKMFLNKCKKNDKTYYTCICTQRERERERERETDTDRPTNRTWTEASLDPVTSNIPQDAKQVTA